MTPLESVEQSENLAPLIGDYAPPSQNFDEMVGRDGQLREHWRPFLNMLAALGPDEVRRRFASADRHLRESGVFYRVYEDPQGAVRPWPLSHVPLLIDADEQPTLVERFKIEGFPATLFFGPDGKCRGRTTGYLSPAKTARMLDKLSAPAE